MADFVRFEYFDVMTMREMGLSTYIQNEADLNEKMSRYKIMPDHIRLIYFRDQVFEDFEQFKQIYCA